MIKRAYLCWKRSFINYMFQSAIRGDIGSYSHWK